MKRRNQANTLMAELMIVVFFFAIAATVLLQVFVAAGNLSGRAGAECLALPEAQNVRDCLYAAKNEEEALLSMGFSQNGEAWEKNEGECLYRVLLSEEPGEAGVLRLADVCAYYRDEELLRLSAAAYIAGGEQP